MTRAVPNLHVKRGASMSVALALGLGFFVLTAVASVLAVGLISGYQSTVKLLQQKAYLIVSAEVSQVRFYLESARNQVDFIVNKIEQNEVAPGTNEEFVSMMTGALAATPQIINIQYVDAGDELIGIARDDNSTSLRLGSLRGDDDLKKLIEDVRQNRTPRWGELLWREAHGQATLNYHAPVMHNGQVTGVASVMISVTRLSEAISDIESEFGANAFILYGRNQVLAHPLLSFGYEGLTRLNPLPRQDSFTDPVLSSMWQEQQQNFIEQELLKFPGVRFVRLGQQSYIILYRKVDEYSDRSLLIGTHLPSVDILSELKRLKWALILCLIISACSAMAAAYIGHRIAGPVKRLADGAANVHDLDLASVEPIEGSFFRELNDAANSFNSMLGGLRWFERYVPKALVQRLIRLNDDSAVDSRHRSVTVMFSDIRGFTQATEHMTAADTVELLNRHFTLLANCIEKEGGIIDRFEGDGLLAIWGSLEPHDDMADRACRAADAIRQAIIAENRLQSKQGGMTLQIRIGIHTGQVIVGNLGSPGRIHFTVSGDTVNITRRIEQLGKTVGKTEDTVNILVSGAVRSALMKSLPMTHLGPHSLRGRSEQVEIYYLDQSSRK